MKFSSAAFPLQGCLYYISTRPARLLCLRDLSLNLQVLDACLKEIVTALLQADVNVRLVGKLRDNVKTRANNADKGAGLNKRKIIEKAVVDELSSMLSSGVDEKKLVDLKKGQPNVIMFVGLQVCPVSLINCFCRSNILQGIYVCHKGD